MKTSGMTGIQSQILKAPWKKDEIKRLRRDIDAAELELVSTFFRRGFCFDPKKRPTAAELLEDPSFKALMDRYR